MFGVHVRKLIKNFSLVTSSEVNQSQVSKESSLALSKIDSASKSGLKGLRVYLHGLESISGLSPGPREKKKDRPEIDRDIDPKCGPR